MLRQNVHPRTTFAGGTPPAAGDAVAVRRSATAIVAAVVRLLFVPFAAAAAALAGLLFAVLLPICGIASIAEGIAKASSRFVRDAFVPAPHPPARHI